MIVLAELTPLDPVLGTRQTVRAASANLPEVTALNSVIWRPAISETAEITTATFKGDFDGTATVSAGSMALQVDQIVPALANARRFVWSGASVKLWAGTAGQAWPWTQVFEGLVGERPEARGNTVTLPLVANLEPFKADALTATYAGTGGAEGGADLKGKVKPWLLGRCFNVEPVLIDAVNSVFQVSAYGAIEAVAALYERGSAFTTSSGNHATYAALVAATIAPGQWATCLAAGMFRLGAPPYGVITADVDGDNVGGTWWRKTGEIITRVATNAGASAMLETASLAALDAALAGLSNQGRIGVYLTGQETVLDLAARLAAPCNAQAGVSRLGKLFATRPLLSGPSVTLDAQQRQMPRVTASTETGVSPPFSLIQFGYAKSWRVHSSDEIAFTAELVEVGLYSGATTYREGNIASLADGSRWLYTYVTPTAGNAPPTWPTSSNTWWSNLSPPLTAEGVAYADGTPIEDLKPAQIGATEGAPTGTPVGSITAADVSSTISSGGGVAANKVATTAIVANGVTVPWLVSGSSTVTIGATETEVLSLSLTKADDNSLLEVHGQVPLFGADAVKVTVSYQLKQSTTIIAQRDFTLEVDGNGDTYLPFSYEHYFDAIDAGSYTLKVYCTRTTANTCSTYGTYHARAREFLR